MRPTALQAKFYGTTAGAEPVREWILGLEADDRQAVGRALRTVQYGWPIGMPLVRFLEAGLWEIRVGIRSGDVRIIFAPLGERLHVLHAFAKKSRKTPKVELALARRRLKEVIRVAQAESERDR